MRVFNKRFGGKNNTLKGGLIFQKQLLSKIINLKKNVKKNL